MAALAGLLRLLMLVVAVVMAGVAGLPDRSLRMLPLHIACLVDLVHIVNDCPACAELGDFVKLPTAELIAVGAFAWVQAFVPFRDLAIPVATGAREALCLRRCEPGVLAVAAAFPSDHPRYLRDSISDGVLAGISADPQDVVGEVVADRRGTLPDHTP
jgi:hypothetical protein